MEKTKRVSPSIKIKAYDKLNCYDVTPKEGLERYADALSYGYQVAEKIYYLSELKSFYEGQVKDAQTRLDNVTQELDKVLKLKENKKQETASNLKLAKEELYGLLNVQYERYIAPKRTKTVTKLDINDVERIASHYGVPIKALLTKDLIDGELPKNFFKYTFENYDTYIIDND